MKSSNLAAFILLVLLSLLIITNSLAQLTSHDNLKPLFVKTTAPSISQGQLAAVSDAAEAQCTQTTNKLVLQPISIMGKDFSIVLECSDAAGADSKKLAELITSAAFETIYYTLYDCDFLSCSLAQRPGYLFSSTACIFFSSLVLPFAVLSVLFAALVVYLLRKDLPSLLRTFGVVLMVLAIPFIVVFAFKVSFPLQPIDTLLDISGFLLALVGGALIFLAGVVLERSRGSRKK